MRVGSNTCVCLRTIVKPIIFFGCAEKELLSLEEELTHFQRKIEKHDWIRNQVDDVEADVKEGDRRL